MLCADVTSSMSHHHGRERKGEAAFVRILSDGLIYILSFSRGRIATSEHVRDTQKGVPVKGELLLSLFSAGGRRTDGMTSGAKRV